MNIDGSTAIVSRYPFSHLFMQTLSHHRIRCPAMGSQFLVCVSEYWRFANIDGSTAIVSRFPFSHLFMVSRILVCVCENWCCMNIDGSTALVSILSLIHADTESSSDQMCDGVPNSGMCVCKYRWQHCLYFKISIISDVQWDRDFWYLSEKCCCGNIGGSTAIVQGTHFLIYVDIESSSDHMCDRVPIFGI